MTISHITIFLIGGMVTSSCCRACRAHASASMVSDVTGVTGDTPRRACRPRLLGQAVEPVAGVAEARHDVADLVELLVDGAGDQGDRR